VHDAVLAFRPGDFLLTSSDAGLARLLGWATGSQINHAGVIMDPMGTVVEANPTLLDGGRALRLTTIADYLKAGKPCWIGYVELREGSRQDVVAFVEHLFRAQSPASASGQLWQALHTIIAVAPRAWSRHTSWLRPLHSALDQHALVVREEHCYASAELVARALERGGFIWDRDPAHITPADLFERYHHVDAPVAIEPKPISIPHSAARATASRRVQAGRSATITSLPARTIRGTTALAEAPQQDEQALTGMRALLQVGVLMAAGLAVIGVLEEMLHGGPRDG
jgi:hypothetical protein